MNQSGGPPGGALKPLTRQNREGKVYERLPAVDAQIMDALIMAPDAMVLRAQREKDDPQYLQEEVLVYLIREALQQNNRDLAGKLAEILHDRCLSLLKEWLKPLDQPTFDNAYIKITEEMLNAIFELNSDRGDFWQVRFLNALHRRVISAFNKAIRERKAAKEIAEEEQPPSGSTLSPEEALDLKDGLAAIKDIRHRSAFLLRYYQGWPIESTDPAEMSISRHFKKTPRTIANWLEQAERDLKEWRGGKR